MPATRASGLRGPGSKAVERHLARFYLDQHPGEAARVLEWAAVDEAAALLASEATGRAAKVLRLLTPDAAAALLEKMEVSAASRLVEALEPNRAGALLARVTRARRALLLEHLPDGLANELRALMSYPPDSAGALMDPRVTTLPANTTVRDVRRRLRDVRRRRIQDVFLVDDGDRLVGSAAVLDVLLARPEETLHSLARAEPPRVGALAPREEVLEVLDRHRARSLPVVDLDGRILGVLRQDELIATAEQAATADMVTMVGAGKEERALSPPLLAIRKRLPWLEINLLTAFLAASVVGIFEDTIARYTALAVLLPVVAGQSGNTGAQALAVTMRGLALREIRLRHWLRVTSKELLVGAMNGVAVALTTATAVFVWSQSLGLALVIGVSMVLSMMAAGLSGAAIPLVLTRLGQDPAQSSSIILTTVTDVVGFFSFLGIATALAAML